MALHRMLQLNNALAAMIASVQYKDIRWTKMTRPTKMEAFIDNKGAWYSIYAVLLYISSTMSLAVDRQGFSRYG
jgi:hypothetical protein